MKILIVSDTHGHDENLERVLEIEKPINRLIHLGDVEGSEDYIEQIAECPCNIVSGNNDFFCELPRARGVYAGTLPCADHPRTLLLCFFGYPGAVPAGSVQRRGHCHVRPHPQAVSGKRRRSDAVKSGKPFLSQTGRTPPKLHCHGTGQRG